jgi:hypothetical protein
MDRSSLPAASEVTVEVLAIGEGRHIVHVRVPARLAGASGLAWEALLADGHEPIFAGLTGFRSGDPGERLGQTLRFVPSGSTTYVVLGDIREDVTLCGQEMTQLEPRALYPASLDLRPATVQRLSERERENADSVTVTEKGTQLEPALARLLVARGSSVPGSRGLELVDGDPQTVWRELRPGVGQGEFVTMAAPQGLPITRVQIKLAGGGLDAGKVVAPRTFYLMTATRIFAAILPAAAAQKPGEVYELRFPEPLQSSCLALVLDSAFVPAQAHPDVGLAELVAYSEFDEPGATLDGVAKLLSGERGLQAAQLLERAGPGALEAVANAYDALSSQGRARAVDAAASVDPCERAAPLLARAFCEGGGEASRKAKEKLERCPAAAPAIAQRLRTVSEDRACLAPMLATLAPAGALGAIADAVGATPEGDHATRATLRASLGQALGRAPVGSLAALLGDVHRDGSTRLELMRGAGDRIAEARAEAIATLEELLGRGASTRVRYLVLGPLAALARAGEPIALARLQQLMVKDASWEVRARASEVAAGVAAVQAALTTASRDPWPRVREAAFTSLAAAPPQRDAIAAASKALAADEWSFVRAKAVGVLLQAPPLGDVDEALGGAIGDSSARVRGAAVVALGRRRARRLRGAIAGRLDAEDESIDVRAAAATALAALCDTDSVDRLTKLAQQLATAVPDATWQPLRVAALAALAALHPSDLRQRLAPLLSSGSAELQTAAKKALAARGMCGGAR